MTAITGDRSSTICRTPPCGTCSSMATIWWSPPMGAPSGCWTASALCVSSRHIPTGASPFLFTPGVTYRVRRDTNTDTPLPPGEPAGENPPDGAIIDYALPAGIQGPVQLEIIDARGTVVRQYSSTGAVTPTAAELAEQLIPPYWPQMNRPLPATPGMHRQIWDLHYTAPEAIRYEYPISAVPHRTPTVPQGPLALPGTYTVKLIAAGHSYTAPLTITMDPRVHTSAGDLQQLFQSQEQMAKTLSTISEATLEAHGAAQQIAAAEEKSRRNPVLQSAIQRFDTALNILLQGSTSASSGEDQQNAPGLDSSGRERHPFLPAARPVRRRANGFATSGTRRDQPPGCRRIIAMGAVQENRDSCCGRAVARCPSRRRSISTASQRICRAAAMKNKRLYIFKSYARHSERSEESRG